MVCDGHGGAVDAGNVRRVCDFEFAICRKSRHAVEDTLKVWRSELGCSIDAVMGHSKHHFVGVAATQRREAALLPLARRGRSGA